MFRGKALLKNLSKKLIANIGKEKQFLTSGKLFLVTPKFHAWLDSLALDF
jgi:hypothetical protein